MKIHVPATMLAAFATQASVMVSQKRLGQKLAFLNALFLVLLTHFTILTWFAVEEEKLLTEGLCRL